MAASNPPSGICFKQRRAQAGRSTSLRSLRPVPERLPPPTASCVWKWIRRAGAFIRWSRYRTARPSRSLIRSTSTCVSPAALAKRRVLRELNMDAWWRRLAPISSSACAVRGPPRLLRWFVFERLLPSRTLLRIAGWKMYVYQASGLQKLVRASGILKWMGRLGELEPPCSSRRAPVFLPQHGTRLSRSRRA